MPDISMCANCECPLRKKCYRYRAVPDDSGYQTYADFKPVDDKCDSFWELDSRRIEEFKVSEERHKKLYNFWHKGGIWDTRKKDSK